MNTSRLEKLTGTTLATESRRAGPFGPEFTGAVVVSPNGPTLACTVEIVDLTDVDPGERTTIIAAIRERARALASRDWRHVIPPLQVDETDDGGIAVTSLTAGRPLRDDVEGYVGHPRARSDGNLAAWFEQLLIGLAELHAAGLQLGECEVEDVVTSGDGDHETLRWGHATTLVVIPASRRVCLRRDLTPRQATAADGSNARLPRDFPSDLRRLCRVVCQLASGVAATDGADGVPGLPLKAIRDRRLRSFVDDLLSEDGGFVDAVAALRAWRRRSRARTTWSRNAARLATCLAFVAVLACGWYASRASRVKRDYDKLESRFAELTRLDRPADAKSATGDASNSEVCDAARRLRSLLPKTEADDPLERDEILAAAKADLQGEATADRQLAQIERWLAEMIKPQDYKLAVANIVASSEEASTAYLVSAYVDDRLVGTIEWPPVAEDDAGETQNALRDLIIPWSAKNASIRMLVERDDYWMNADCIDRTYRGPMAMWLLHAALQGLTQEEVTIKGAVVNCGGPPRDCCVPLDTFPLLNQAQERSP